MRWTLLLLALAACGPRPSAEDPGLVVGTVVSVDREPMAYDGDAEIVVRTDDGRTVTVRIPARMNLCAAEGLARLDGLAAGDRVEVRGDVGPEGDVTPCTDAGHHLRVDP